MGPGQKVVRGMPRWCLQKFKRTADSSWPPVLMFVYRGMQQPVDKCMCARRTAAAFAEVSCTYDAVAGFPGYEATHPGLSKIGFCLILPESTCNMMQATRLHQVYLGF